MNERPKMECGSRGPNDHEWVVPVRQVSTRFRFYE